MRVFIALLLTFTILGCGNNRSTPQPQPTPTIEAPTPRPTQNPLPFAQATPHPVPQFDPSRYIPASPLVGTTVTVSGENLSARVQAAQDDPNVGTVVIGSGSLTRAVIFRKHTRVETSPSEPLKCDINQPHPLFEKLIAPSDYGCILVSDGVYFEGTYRAPKELADWATQGNHANWRNDAHFKKLDQLTNEQIAGNGSVILGPTMIGTNKQPQVAVIQSLGDVLGSHTQKATGITIKGIVIKGRQTLYDGGVRSTVQLGNCHGCSVQEMFLWDTDSIGISAGGSAREKGNYSNDVLFYRNIFSGVPAANMAAINSENFIATQNYVRRPGHDIRNISGHIGGGICGLDLETNDPADHSKNVNAFNNLIDFEGAMQEGAGNGLCLQDPYVGANRGPGLVANNLILGGRDSDVKRYMSNGIFLNGLKGWTIAVNQIYKSAQNAIQVYAIESCLIQDNTFDMTGGGGLPSFWSQGMHNTIVRRNNFIKRDLPFNVQAGFFEKCGSGNTYEDNFIPGEAANPQATKQCP